MQTQKIWFKATEAYEENGFFELQQEELDFLLNRLKELNQKNELNSLQMMEVKGIAAILLYGEKEDYIEKDHLRKTIQEAIIDVCNQFNGIC